MEHARRLAFVGQSLGFMCQLNRRYRSTKIGVRRITKVLEIYLGIREIQLAHESKKLATKDKPPSHTFKLSGPAEVMAPNGALDPPRSRRERAPACEKASSDLPLRAHHAMLME